MNPDTTTEPNPVVLITGANRGIGLATAAQLALDGWTVWLGARDLVAGAAAAEGLAGDVRPIQLDVTDDASVAAAVERVREDSGHLDALVNNAGISGRFVAPEQTTPADFLPVYGVNLLGPVRVSLALLPLLRAARAPRLVMVSSSMGSFGITTDPDQHESTLHGLVYSSSKAALNMVTSQLSKALVGVRVTAVDPGFTATGLNNFRGFQKPEEGATAVVRAVIAEDLPGVFVNADGVVPW